MTDKYIRKTYPETIIAYFAGIVDGEGALTAGSYAKAKNGNPWYTTYLIISSTDEILIDWLVDHFGSKKFTYTRKQTPKNSTKTVFKWQCTGERLLHLCELIYPYLIIKKRQAEIIMEMVKSGKQKFWAKGLRGPQVLPEIHSLRANLCLELRSLHARRGSLTN
jgi:hypothetical protein